MSVEFLAALSLVLATLGGLVVWVGHLTEYRWIKGAGIVFILAAVLVQLSPSPKNLRSGPDSPDPGRIEINSPTPTPAPDSSEPSDGSTPLFLPGISIPPSATPTTSGPGGFFTTNPPPSGTPCPSPSPTKTTTPPPSPSPTDTGTPTPSPTPSPTDTGTPTPTPTDTGTPTPTPTDTGTPTPTPTDTGTPTPTPTDTGSPSPSLAPPRAWGLYWMAYAMYGLSQPLASDSCPQ